MKEKLGPRSQIRGRGLRPSWSIRALTRTPGGRDHADMAGDAARISSSNLLDELRSRVLFADLNNDQLAAFIRSTHLIHLKPKERLSEHIEQDGVEHFYFVLEGQLGVIRPRIPAATEVPRSMLPNPQADFLFTFEVEDVLSDAYVGEHVNDALANIDCVAVVRTTLVALARTELLQLYRINGEWAQRVMERIEDARLRYQESREPRRRLAEAFRLQHNFSYATTMKVIDVGLCIGCDGCERACSDRHGLVRLVRKGPELGAFAFPVSCRTCTDHRCLPACGFDALDLKEHELRIDPKRCVGCAACASACPNNVITMHEKAFSSDDFPNPMPDTDNVGRTNVPGVYLVGEASGAALIKVAINGGRTAVEDVVDALGDKRGTDGLLDLVVVGAGPAGLSAALAAKEMGLDFKVFDKGHFATTIQSYPRHKVVMAEPAHIPLYGNLWLKDTTKEELIHHWETIIRETGLELHSHEPVTEVITHGPDELEVVTGKGRYRARRVILAVGTRGTPRKLGVEGEAEPRVRYTLTDPTELQDRRVLVVGGGDSAVEAAMSIADMGGKTQVTLSYRRDSFGRIKARNKTRIEEYARDGKVKLIMSSSVKALGAGSLTLKIEGGETMEIENDFVFALLGAEPPTAFFERIGIRIVQPGTIDMVRLAATRGNRRYANKCDHCADHGEQACIAACPTGAIMELSPARVFAEDSALFLPPEEAAEPLEPETRHAIRRRVAMLSATIAIAAAAIIGLECFLRRLMPDYSAQALWQRQAGLEPDVSFTPGNGLGFWLGVAGSILMLLTALYPLHSRIGWLRGRTETRGWLAAHILAGILGPIFVTYHTTVKLDRWPSLAFWLMWLVVFSGAFGRYVNPRLKLAAARRILEKQLESAELGPSVERKEGLLAATWRHAHIILTALMFIIGLIHVATAMLFKAT